jgi:hypothetical protein
MSAANSSVPVPSDVRIARRSAWPLWSGFALALIAFVSYPFYLVRFPVTRDFPWLTLMLFMAAAVLVVAGLRRAFGSGGRGRKIVAAFVAGASVLLLTLFVFGFFVFARQLPTSKGAPQVGQRAPDFTLTDSNGKPVTLAQLLSTPIGGRPAKGALLVFYRGYW